uniref:Large ribosomal subunit protein bL25 beta domain-containing protein n=1 Tax=Dunaliella tertiolecta TaxID=3047 RepID=A0A7S3QLJ2_DUNTE
MFYEGVVCQDRTHHFHGGVVALELVVLWYTDMQCISAYAISAPSKQHDIFVMFLRASSSTVHVQPQKVHMTATKAFVVQNVDFLYCPHDRIVNVDVPVRLINDDKAPGVKQGGWMQMFRRTVRFQAQGQFIPPYVDVDVGELGLEQELLVNQIPVPPGCRLPANKVSLAPVLRCTTSMTDTA